MHLKIHGTYSIDLGVTMDVMHNKEWCVTLHGNRILGVYFAIRDYREHMVKGQGDILMKMPNCDCGFVWSFNHYS